MFVKREQCLADVLPLPLLPAAVSRRVRAVHWRMLLARSFSTKDLRLLESILRPSSSFLFSSPAAWSSIQGSALPRQPDPSLRRGAKTVTRRKVKDLQQGAILAEPLPELGADERPQYPSVLQGARDNMLKFDNCVLLTRVGNFYEVGAMTPRSSQPER